MAEPAVVIGGSIAGLVAADAIAARGRPVRLILGERGVGSGFLPMRVGERTLELGPRFIELSYDGAVDDPPPLDAYEPGPHGHRPYLRLVQELVASLAPDDLVEARRPELVRGGARVTDFLLCGDLVDLARVLDGRELQAVADETAGALEREGDAGLLAVERQPDLWQLSLADASRRNHGATFHDAFIEPIAAKIVSGGSDNVLAALRRKIWLPLFYPSTLHEAATGRLRYRPDRPLHTVTGGGMGALVSRLLDRAKANGAVVERRGAIASMRAVSASTVLVAFKDGTEEEVSQPVIAGSADEVFGAVGIIAEVRRSRTVMAWVDVAEPAIDAPSTMFVADPQSALYRVSHSMAPAPAGTTTLSCELRHDVPASDAGREASDALVQLGLVGEGTPLSVVHAVAVDSFTAPSAENDVALRAAVEQLAALELPVHVVGGASASGADSFNEQIVQGLAVAERLS